MSGPVSASGDVTLFGFSVNNRAGDDGSVEEKNHQTGEFATVTEEHAAKNAGDKSEDEVSDLFEAGDGELGFASFALKIAGLFRAGLGEFKKSGGTARDNLFIFGEQSR